MQHVSRWDVERAQRWRNEHPWEVGANFTPSSASNQLEMWQASTFDLTTIDRELGFAAQSGMSVMRVFLHDVLFTEDPSGFLHRIDKYLEVSAKHSISTMFVLFDGCWRPEGQLGTQPEPLQRYHNSQWLQAPLLQTLRNVDRWCDLEAYVKGVIGRFGSDSRVHSWDLYNEVDNWQLELLIWFRVFCARSTAKDFDLRFRLLQSAFRWSREVNPSQPLTVCEWEFMGKRFRDFVQEHADIATFHIYGDMKATKKELFRMKKAYPGRPLLLSEYMARHLGSTFEANLALLKENDVGAINWGLVQGRTGTIWPWWSWVLPWQWLYSMMQLLGIRPRLPSLWFHDVFWQDGTPFSFTEMELIKRLTRTIAS